MLFVCWNLVKIICLRFWFVFANERKLFNASSRVNGCLISLSKRGSISLNINLRRGLLFIIKLLSEKIISKIFSLNLSLECCEYFVSKISIIIIGKSCAVLQFVIKKLICCSRFCTNLDVSLHLCASRSYVITCLIFWTFAFWQSERSLKLFINEFNIFVSFENSKSDKSILLNTGNDAFNNDE